MSLAKPKGIILKKILYQDSDLILKVLLSNGEKVDLMAKAALKSKKRFGGGVLEPLNYVELTYQNNSRSEIKFLSEAQIVYDFEQIKTDYDRIKMALYFLKLINKVELSSLDDASKVFDLLLHTLKSAEKTKYLSILKSQFEIKFLNIQGVLEMNSELMVFLKTSLYDSDKLRAHRGIDAILRRSSYEIENYLEQNMDMI